MVTPDLGVDDPRWKVPPSLDVMLRSLSTLRRPAGSLYRLYTDPTAVQDDTPTGYRYGPNRIDVEFDTGREHLPYADVAQARTVFEWEPNPKPGARRNREAATR